MDQPASLHTFALPTGKAYDPEYERKQRNREYRVAARREKRNRKADEKKQRKLNALVLRRMTRNPEKYNKNAERNRLRAIEMERRKIQQEAVRQAQRLAAIHDSSGESFNVDPVVTLEDGVVITREAFQRRQARLATKQPDDTGNSAEGLPLGVVQGGRQQLEPTIAPVQNDDDVQQIQTSAAAPDGPHRSKSQMKKLAKYAPRPPLPRPILPMGINILEGEEDWLSLWDLDDDELEKRVNREKKRKAAARKALRAKQQSGKAERRMARDEKRRVYRDLKLEWRTIKAETDREKSRLAALEDREVKAIAVHVCDVERRRAMAVCAELGFTLENTDAVQSIQPRALGMRGVEVDFEAIEKGKGQNDISVKRKHRVDLATVPELSNSEYVQRTDANSQGPPNDFISLDVGPGQDFEAINYNHKTRRKLRRAIEHAEVEKELLVRERALDYYTQQGLAVPPILQTDAKPKNSKGQRMMENGILETPKQERVRSRVALAAFNEKMRVLRRQAKERAIFAGLKKHAEVTGRIDSAEDGEQDGEQNEPYVYQPRGLEPPTIPLPHDDNELSLSEDSDLDSDHSST